MSENAEHLKQLSEGKISKLLAKYALPCIVAMLVNSLYNIIDQIFIGQGVGFLGNGATNVVFPLVLISVSLAILVGDGGSAYFNIKLGQGETDKAEKAAAGSVTVILVFSILFTILAGCFLEPILKASGGTDTLMPFAMEYGSIVIIGFPFMMVTTTINALIRADGRASYAMFVMIIGALINVVLDASFIFGCGWGIKGAAWATVIGQVVSFLLSFAYLFRFKNVKLKLRSFLPNVKLMFRSISLGISSFVDQISFTLVIAVLNNLLVTTGAQTEFGGDIPLTVFGIAMKIQQILYAVIIGTALGMQPLTGYNYGARNYKRVRKIFFFAVIAASIASVVGEIILISYPRGLILMFGSNEPAAYYDFADLFFRGFFALTFFMGFQTVTGIFFQSIGRPISASILSICYQIVFRIAFAMMLAFSFGLGGVIASWPTAEAVTLFLTVSLLVYELKKLKKRENNLLQKEMSNG